MLKVIGTYYCEDHDEVEQQAANFKRTLNPDEAVLLVYPDIRLCGGFKQMIVTSYSQIYRAVLDSESAGQGSWTSVRAGREH